MLKRGLFSAVLLLLFLPVLQKWLQVFTIPKLNGDFKEAERPVFNKNDWYQCKFQEAYVNYLEQKTGFHNTLVRICNQIDFTFFRYNRTNDVVIGKDDYILGNEYIRSYQGNDYIGELAVDKKLRRLKYLQEYLKTQGKNLVLILEPGKVSFYPEKIPEYYKVKYPKKRSNYQAFTEKADRLGITYINFNEWFKKKKASTPYLLYPKNGIHWSAYGAWIAADSIVKYIEKTRNIDLPEMVVEKINVSDHIQKFDYDAASTLNLLCKLDNLPMPYPEIKYPVLPGKQKISVLTVGDSYYWNIFNTEMGKHLYNKESFWYFNSIVYPESYTKELRTDSLDLQKEIAKYDVIFLMVTECWWSKFDFDFIDQLFDVYTPELEPDYVYLFEGKIRRDPEWFKLVTEKATRNRQKLEDAIHGDAIYTFRNVMKEKFLLRFGPVYYQSVIESDKNWYSNEIIKAKELNTNLETIIIRDCWYLFQNEYPDLCRQYYAGLKIAAALKNDSAAMKKIINNPWYLRPEEMLWQVSVAKARGGPQFLASLSW